jgi:AbrB family looped-hinge helix DNA binding protein
MSVKYTSDNTAIVTIDKHGRLTIPPRFRKHLGWKTGDLLEITLENNKIILKKVSDTTLAYKALGADKERAAHVKSSAEHSLKAGRL